MTPSKRGFSLVELSIVLVILGLLVGGVLAGQSLIHAAQLRAATEEYNRYNTALKTFRDKYFGSPGDITNATAFWGKDTTSVAACPAQTGTAPTTGPGTCNGNGDGFIGIAGTVITNETYRAWQQLAMAGLVEGSYAGTVSVYNATATAGVDIPQSKVSSQAGWTIVRLSPSGNSELGYTALPNVVSTYLVLGKTNVNYWAQNWFMPAADAWNIDTKIDDGKPSTGMLYGGTAITCANGVFDSTATYNVTSSNPWCLLLFKLD